MRGRITMLGLATAGLLAVSSLPALAQVDDFLCSTFSYKCAPEVAPPPPQLAPEAAPAEPAKPHKKKVKTAKAKKVKAKAAESDAAAPAPAPAPDAAAK